MATASSATRRVSRCVEDHIALDDAQGARVKETPGLQYERHGQIRIKGKDTDPRDPRQKFVEVALCRIVTTLPSQEAAEQPHRRPRYRRSQSHRTTELTRQEQAGATDVRSQDTLNSPACSRSG